MNKCFWNDVLKNFRKSPGVCKLLPQKLLKNLELLQKDSNIILFAWSVFRTSVEDTDDALDYCNMVTCELIKKNAFGALYDLISHQMFKVIWTKGCW